MTSVRPSLPGLHAVRGLAAVVVLFHHVEQSKHIVGWPSAIDVPICKNAGFLGVDLFFVLSGFLITFLLMKERDVNRTIAVTKFYLRRIARIWPVYFALVLVSSLALIHIDFLHFPLVNPARDDGVFDRGLWLYLAMCPQLVPVGTPPLAFATVLWSVGVEEHFYVVWPHVIRFTGRAFPWAAGCLIVVVAGARAGLHFLPEAAMYNSRFDCLAIGGVSAWVALYSPTLLALLRRRAVVILFATAMLWLALTRDPFGAVDHDLFCVVAAGLIVNLATGPETIFDNKWLVRLGEVSYGIYAFQWICIVIAVNALRALDLTPTLAALALYPSAVALTLAAALLSYRLLELPALRLKKAFRAVPDEVSAPAAVRP